MIDGAVTIAGARTVGASELAAAQAGDRQAQAAIFLRHRAEVAAFLSRLTGDPTVVDDLVQEVFIAAFAGLPGFRGDAQLSSWLYRICLSKARNFWDAQRRRERREATGAARFSTHAPSAEEDFEAAEQRRALYRALGELPTSYREAFTARILEGMSLADACKLLGAPCSTVSYRTRRAIDLLSRALELGSLADWVEGRA